LENTNKKPEITVPCSRLLFALDYIAFLNQAWVNDRRDGWRFIQPEERFNPRGFAADRAHDIMRRFQLCWVPLYESGFYIAMLHKVALAAQVQEAEFLVPINELIEDLASTTFMHANPAPVFPRGEFGQLNDYNYEATLRRFFAAFACGEIVDQDLRPHLSL